MVRILLFLTLCVAYTYSLSVSSDLSFRLGKGEKVNIFIKLSSDTSNVLKHVSKSRYASRAVKLNSIHGLLQEHAERTQKNIVNFLQAESRSEEIKFESFWITNQIYVRDADAALVEQLTKKFEYEIKSIHADSIVAHITMSERKNATTLNSDDQWGLKKIKVQEAWEQLGYRRGKRSVMPDITIGTIDTGVRRSHNALKDNYVGDYGWMDGVWDELEPDDRFGHGTHTTGTIVGSQGIGVAPWAKWMTCRACPTLGCTERGLIACGQFMACPTLPDGTSPDCSRAPRLVSNSWSAGSGSTFFDDVLAAWKLAEIIAVFSIGNFGNAFCSSAFYPGDLDTTLGIGSTTRDDNLSWFTSIGPTKFGGDLIKPDVVAPGSDILSASYKGDDLYELQSGTSQSCPHISGVVVMLLTQNPEITFEEVKKAITQGTDIGMISRGLTCLGVPDTSYPNYVYGHGRVNALKSLLYSPN